MNSTQLNELIISYIGTALWSSTDNGYFGENDPRNNEEGSQNGGDPLDKNFDYTDVSNDTRAQMEEDCRDFVELAGKKLDGFSANIIGHDFWLTRNHHGAGFWDGDYVDSQGNDLGDLLTEDAQSFGEVYLYVGDDGKIYQE